MIRTLLGAVQFLTVIPVRAKTTEPGRAALFFPLVGAGMGWFGGALFLMSQQVFPVPLAALLVVVFWVTITGGLHEDGLADVADAFRSGRSPDRVLEILKDSRIGSYGALAIALSVLLRWQALVAISANLLPVLVASQAVSRAAMVALAWITRPAGTGLGAAFCAGLSTPVALGALAQGIAAALWCGAGLGTVMLAASLIVVLLARAFFHRVIGGVTGDCLGATSQAVEIVLLLLAAAA
jgi:adenosylcobinamide-GDP ribazoletransferase